MAEQKRDYYEVLGVEKTADDAALKKAYRALAKKYHPDTAKDKASSTEFTRINTAYETLKKYFKKTVTKL